MADMVGDGWVGEFDSLYEKMKVSAEGVAVERFGLIHHWVSAGHSSSSRCCCCF